MKYKGKVSQTKIGFWIAREVPQLNDVFLGLESCVLSIIFLVLGSEAELIYRQRHPHAKVDNHTARGPLLECLTSIKNSKILRRLKVFSQQQQHSEISIFQEYILRLMVSKLSFMASFMVKTKMHL